MQKGEHKEMNGKCSKYKKMKNKDIKIKEMINQPTPHYLSMIISSLSVRAEKMMEKISGRFS